MSSVGYMVMALKRMQCDVVIAIGVGLGWAGLGSGIGSGRGALEAGCTSVSLACNASKPHVW